MTITYDHLTITNIDEQDEYQTHPDDEPIDVSDQQYRINVHEDHGPRGASTTRIFATEITLNGGSFSVTDNAAITKQGATLAKRDDVKDGLVDIRL